MRKIKAVIIIVGIVFAVSACGAKEQTGETTQQIANPEREYVNISEDCGETAETAELHVPSKEEVFAMREIVLDGMSEEEIERLTENIKVANLRMESAYLYENIFGKLSDKESPYWQYFDQKGDIQLAFEADDISGSKEELEQF